MTRRGQCRCGTVLVFRETAVGYKTRCTKCGAIVRLRIETQTPPVPPVPPTLHKEVPAQATQAIPPLPPAKPSAHAEVLSHRLSPGNSATLPVDFAVFGDHEPTAPTAQEFEAYQQAPEKPVLLWWAIFALGAVLVVVGVAVATMLWG